MALHPGGRKRHFLDEAPVAWDPIRRALEENEDWYRDLVEHSQDLLCVHDLEGRFLSVNPAPARLLGYSVEEALRMRLQDVVDPQFRDQCDAYLREIERTGESRGLMAVVTRSGEQRIWEYHNTLRTEGVAAPIVRGMAHDVTDRVRAEKALSRTNRRLLKTVREQERILQELRLFRTLLDQSNDAILVTEPDTLRLLDVNERTCEVLGYSREELLSMTIHDIAPWFDESARAGVLRQLQESGFAIIERTHRRKDGTAFPSEVNLRRVQLDREYGVAIVRDITRRKRAEGRLREFERVVENLEDMIVVVDREHRYVLANPAYLSYRGVTQEQVVGHLVVELVKPEAYESTIREKLDECFRGKAVNYEMRHQYSEMGERDLSITYLPVEGPEGIDRVACLLRDITERKQAEKALRESERLFRTVYERSPVGIGLVESPSGRFLQVNPKLCEIAGRREEELLRLDVASITHPDDIEQTSEYMRLLAEEKVASYETDKRYLRPDGSVRWVKILVVPMWGKGETRRWQMGLVEDITERKRAEEALRESERRQRLALQIGKIGAFELELGSSRGTWTTEFAEIWGIPSGFVGDFGSFFSWELVHPEDRARIQEAFAQLARSGEPGEAEFRLNRPDGVMQWVRARGLVIADTAAGSLRVVGVIMDITEQKRTEEALRQSEERFRVALKNSPIAVFNQDRDLRYTWMYNPQIPRSVSEYLGKTSDEIFDPAEVAHITEVRRRVLETGVAVRQEMQVTYDGRKHYFDATIEPVFDAAGAVIGLTGASMDVTELRETTEALREAKKKLTEEKLYLEREIDTELGFGDIIGKSKALQSVIEHVGKVAASDATVLLLGETGTGKELVARAVYRLSQRANTSFIKLNCAAIPSGLVESELFGNEKGAFTGAVSKKIGRIELADKGTLFLDEIGEIPLALQPKLLRVLQDQEFERLGGTQTMKVDFRLIAATNRDLAEAVRENEFRSDLYYRLNVFPIRVPPLRERRDDIRLLVEHFVQKCARRMNKSITSIPKKTMDALIGWDWPGNVRELENFVERSVILTQGSVLAAPLSELQPITAEEKIVDESLEAAERKYILRALRESHGQIGGPRGAAARLGLKRTTLQSKLKQLGINPRG
jgi:PAS domain S-box-containing protein